MGLENNMVSRVKGRGEDWEFRIDMCALLYLKQITDKDSCYLVSFSPTQLPGADSGTIHSIQLFALSAPLLQVLHLFKKVTTCCKIMTSVH